MKPMVDKNMIKKKKHNLRNPKKAKKWMVSSSIVGYFIVYYLVLLSFVWYSNSFKRV